LTRVFDPQNQVARHAALGLIANPFFGSGPYEHTAEGCEMTSAANSLLGAILAAAGEERPRPIWVSKDPDLPGSYGLGAEARVEHTLASDDSAGLLHAYIPLFGMRNGAVRSALNLLSERLTYRDLPVTLAAYVDKVLASEDDSLPSYQVMGPEALEEFAEAFSADREAAVEALFGPVVMERRPEFGEIADMRQVNYVGDGEDVPVAEATEVDDTVGDAPGIGAAALAQPEAPVEPYAAVLDYIIDYTREHLSPVIGRAFRVYKERGQSAMAAEFNVTKAPRKTLIAVVKLALARYRKVVLMYDLFDNWRDIDAELRSKIVGLLSEMRWSLDGDAVIAFLMKPETAPELEEAFGSSTRLEWDFPGLIPTQEKYDAIIPEVVNAWLANAATSGAEPLTLESPGIAGLVEASEGSLQKLIYLGQEAIEHAADRGISAIDDEAIAAAIAALPEPEGAIEEL
jgi:hypothetical protein